MTLRVPELYKAFPGAVAVHAPGRCRQARPAARPGGAHRLPPRRDPQPGRDARPQHACRAGVVFVPFFDASQLINKVTLDATDPISKQTDFKKCAVKVVPRPAQRRPAGGAAADEARRRPVALCRAGAVPARPAAAPGAAMRRACAGPSRSPRRRRRRRCSAQVTDDVRRRRNYPDQPPVIPHAIEGYATRPQRQQVHDLPCAQVHRAEPGADDQRHALPGPGRQHPRRPGAAALRLPRLPRAADRRRSPLVENRFTDMDAHRRADAAGRGR